MFIISNLQKKLYQELGYKPDFDKQKDFIQLLFQSLDVTLPLNEIKTKLYDISRFLLCEQEKDEKRFLQIFNQIFDEEKLAFDKEINRKIESAKTEIKTSTTIPKTQNPNETQNDNSEKTVSQDIASEDIAVAEPWKSTNEKKYLNFMPEIQETENLESLNLENNYDFLFTEDYHTISFREMIQSWRYFRLRQPQAIGTELDITKTVENIAKDGFFIEVAYRRSLSNREDALLILVDRRGSMAPFHSLTEHLIRTALTEGGHRKAKIFYFQNYPLEYVYRTPQLTEPIKLKEIFSSTSSEHTYALILSDAGAARGNENPIRISSTVDFVSSLWRNVKDVVWLNPMPRNRWRGTSAAKIAQSEGVKMYSIFDSNRLGMTLAIKDLLYEN
jgi:uncharacterized protein with von Willebrand factor type A (vWA) domain